jgi:hypothetical protein
LRTAPRSWVTTSKGCQDGGRIARVSIGENRGPMPCPETALRIFDTGMGLLLRAFAPYQADDQFAVRRHRRVIPQVASHLGFMGPAALRLFFTTRHCSSHARALGIHTG